MKLSVIIPFYNARVTLRQCLESVFGSSFRDFEVIVIDDSSQDNSGRIAEEFSVKFLRTARNMGSGQARDLGVRNSEGELLVFLDSDVVIRKDTLATIAKTLNENAGLSAIVGLFAKEHPNNNFLSQYKNLYMNFVFSGMPDYIDFLFTSICASRRDAYLGFSAARLKTEDTELGQRYARENKKILLDRTLEVVHLKRYNLPDFIKNEFIVPYCWVKIFLKHKGFKSLLRQKRFAHARWNQILGVIMSPFIIVSMLTVGLWRGSVFLSFALLTSFLILNKDFLVFLYREKGFVFASASFIVAILDAVIMTLGILCGFIFSPIRKFPYLA